MGRDDFLQKIHFLRRVRLVQGADQSRWIVAGVPAKFHRQFVGVQFLAAGLQGEYKREMKKE